MNAVPLGEPVFGLGSLHHIPTHRARNRLLRQALEIGFRAFDVAPAYGNGLNEVELGLALSGQRYAVRVTTKFGIPVDLYGERHPHLGFGIRVWRRLTRRNYGAEYGRRIYSAAEMVASLEGSLRRLRRDCIDDFLIHHPLGVLDDELRAELNATADRLRQQGKIRRWGVAGPAASVVSLLDDPAIEVVQAPLDDLRELAVGQRRRIAYNAYASFRRSGKEEANEFAAFVRSWMQEGIHVIVATRRSETLVGFSALFA